MTTFRRRAHYRTSPSGEYVEVGDQWVTRNDWSRRSDLTHPQAPSPRDPVLVSFPELRYAQTSKSAYSTARYLNPNARCPVCGDPVFYYQNEHGSRVFFDEVGPPWPKHQCTSQCEISARAVAPRWNADIALISNWFEENGNACDAKFRRLYGHNPWQLATILKRFGSSGRVFMVLNLVGLGSMKKVFVSCKSLPRCCREGVSIAIRRRKISFMNTAVPEPREVSIERYRTASAFIEAMTSSE